MPEKPIDENKSVLTVSGLEAWYGESKVLHGVDFELRPGETVTLVGRNGVGKTTILRSIVGIVQKRGGSILFNDVELTRIKPYEVGRLGLAYVPEERGIFSTLTVEENLLLPPTLGRKGLSLEAIYEMFPNLQARARSVGTRLSGGEQQMLAIARVLRAGARVLLLDEPTEGLAPVIVDRIGDLIRQLKADGYTILLVEQNLRFASELSDRLVVIENGRVAETVEGGDFDARIQDISSYLMV